MKELKLETREEVYAVGELDNIYRQLYEAAFEASKKAYAPYSKFHVGAAVLFEKWAVLSGDKQAKTHHSAPLLYTSPTHETKAQTACRPFLAKKKTNHHI